MLSQFKRLCSIYRIKLNKSLGQNFLHNLQVYKKIIESANLTKNDFVLEIGPGFGVLTEFLVEKAKKVIAFEIDKKLFSILQVKFFNKSNIKLVNQDILKVSNQQIVEMFPSEYYKVVANIPYSITSLILQKFTLEQPSPHLCVFLVQDEVAKRVCAKPGKMSRLSVFVQLFCKVEYIQKVGADNFFPKPKVDSAIIRLIKTDEHLQKLKALNLDLKYLLRIVRIGFSSKRKQLHNNLSAGLKIPSQEIKNILRKLNLDENIRAQNLSIDDWIALSCNLQ